MIPATASESSVACARCGAAHGNATMRLGRRELALDPGSVLGVRKGMAGELQVICRLCGHATHHRAAGVRQLPSRAA